MERVAKGMIRHRLIAERLKRQLTQAQVARALGISQSTVAELELGVKEPSFRMMKRFATFYGASVDELFYAADRDSPEQGHNTR